MGITDRPVALVVSKQDLPVLDRTRLNPASGLRRGAYVLLDPPNAVAPQAIVIATGSEVALALQAQSRLAESGVAVRVVSMPSWALFAEQDQQYRDTVLPPDIHARVTVEAASPFGWERYAGDRGRIIAMTGFGASGPSDEVRAHFGFTADRVVDAVRDVLAVADAPAML